MRAPHRDISKQSKKCVYASSVGRKCFECDAAGCGWEKRAGGWLWEILLPVLELSQKLPQQDILVKIFRLQRFKGNDQM